MYVFRFWSWVDMGVKIYFLDVMNYVVEFECDIWYGLKEGNFLYGLEIYLN